MIYVFEDSILERAANSYVVEDREVLDVFAQTYSTSMRTDRNAKLRRHQQHGKHFINSSEATAVDLAVADRSRLQQLLEHHAAMTVFARGNSQRSDCLRYGCMTQYIVG